MRRSLSIEGRLGIVERSINGASVHLSISEVLKRYGTEAMLALDRGETVHIITETEEDKLNDRPGS
jgi:hypothetical protein